MPGDTREAFCVSVRQAGRVSAPDATAHTPAPPPFARVRGSQTSSWPCPRGRASAVLGTEPAQCPARASPLRTPRSGPRRPRPRPSPPPGPRPHVRPAWRTLAPPHTACAQARAPLPAVPAGGRRAGLPLPFLHFLSPERGGQRVTGLFLSLGGGSVGSRMTSAPLSTVCLHCT